MELFLIKFVANNAITNEKSTLYSYHNTFINHFIL